MIKRIQDIASINTGLYLKVVPTGNILYLQAKDFDDSGRFQRYSNINLKVHWDNRIEKHLLKDGDVLFMAKGSSNKACLYKIEIGQAVASSVFFVIRLKVKFILPEYLQWYLNTPLIQRALFKFSEGTHIQSISRRAMKTIEIEIPSLEQQKNILEGQLLWEKEKKLMLELIQKKELFYRNILFNATKSNY